MVLISRSRISFAERPVTVSQGTNTVGCFDPQRVVAEALAVWDGKGKASSVPELWDRKAAERIVHMIACRCSSILLLP